MFQQLVLCKRCNKATKSNKMSIANPFGWKNTCINCVIKQIEFNRKNRPIKIKKKRLKHKISNQDMLSEIKNLKLLKGCESSLCKWKGEFSARMLEFHHLRDKSFNIGEFSTLPNWNREIILADIEKCQVLCRNCHSLANNLERYG